MFESVDGHPMFERHWLPGGAGARDLVIVHGYAEHRGRCEHAGLYFAERGVAVHAYDVRGHGCSGGARVLVRPFKGDPVRLARFPGVEAAALEPSRAAAQVFYGIRQARAPDALVTSR
ncbi:MAG TPA: alpha/beta hydrolase [Dehalococcoidia bacterium]|nr:alpha/beta hydrolase [Dehalococcoidia bacterium]